MSNMIKRGDFLVFQTPHGEVTEFFISTMDFNLDECHRSAQRKSVPGCKGFRMSTGHFYEQVCSYWVDRKATDDERKSFLNWMKEHGYKFHRNTLDIQIVV